MTSPLGSLVPLSFTSLTINMCRSVVKGLTRNPGVLSSAALDPLGFFVGMSLGKTIQNLSLILVKPRRDRYNVSCHRDMTEILLKSA